MASIVERDGRYRVQIRKKGGYYENKVFAHRKDAELYAAWKDDLIERTRNFNLPLQNMMTLIDAVTMKIAHMRKNDMDKRSIHDIEAVSRNDFSEFLNSFIHEITYEKLYLKSQDMLNQKIKRGGSKKSNTGRQQIQSPISVIKKLRVLGSILSYAISLGANIDNPVPRLTAFLSKGITKSVKEFE